MLAVVAGVLAIAIAGVYLGRTFFPQAKPSAERTSRPIVQIVRQQPGLPDLSDVIDRLCPSIALAIPRDADPAALPDNASVSPAFAVSGDGWLLAPAASLPQGQADAVFGDGTRVTLSEVRTDPVSGLAIVKADGASPTALTFTDQGLSRVGQFGLTVSTPLGKGCSADARMIASDFLADGGQSAGYVRVEADPDSWVGGLPFVGSDGRLLGVTTAEPLGAVLPGPIAAVIVDELIRNQLAPSTGFGFRATDYAPPLSTRLGDLRTGAGVALVQPKSTAARAGLQAGDIVTAVDDTPVSGASELNRALDAEPKSATLMIQRGSKQLKLTIARMATS